MMSSASLCDQREREEALTPDRSYIVQAPAGSGKTGLLVQRYLRLLAVVKRPESIVAMTFTRKAAAEMKERIFESLQKASKPASDSEGFEQRTRELAAEALAADRANDWNLLQDPARLQIQTIDSLCASLVRQMPIVSESGGFGGVIEDAYQLYRLATRRMLQRLTEAQDESRFLFSRAALHFDNDIVRLELQIADMLAKRDQWQFNRIDFDSELAIDFRSLLALAAEELREVFRQHSAVDFTEVTRAAITALGKPEAPSDLLYALDYRIEHLLVDEFQDTSKAQFNLLEALTGQWSNGDGRTLFLVGDPVQSIYRFRGAEVGLFLQTWDSKRLGSVSLKPLALSMNFRSRPEIVDWTQSNLAHVLSEDNVDAGAVKLRPTVASTDSTGEGPKLMPLLDDQSGAEEARLIVELAQKYSKRGEVAILLRSRTHVGGFLPALRNAGIDYEAVEIDLLKDQQHILDLLSLIRALSHLADRISWLACLRAPWCGLTLADLAALAEHEPRKTIFDLVSDPDVIVTLSVDGRFRAVRFQEIMSATLAKVGRLELRDLLEQTWIALGGPTILTRPNQREDAETFFKLISSFEEGGTIRDFSLLSSQLERLYAKPSSSGAAVKVMTIHEAKGLEFDTVILPKLGSPPKQDDAELLIWTEKLEHDGTMNLEVVAQPQKGEDDADYKRVRDELKIKTRHEAKRLFYVACTRARNHLFLIGSVKRKKGGGCCKAAETTFLGMIWPHVSDKFESLARRVQPTQANLFSLENASPVNVLRRLPVSWRASKPAPSVEWHSNLHQGIASARKITYEWVSGTGRHVGTVVHEILRHAANGPATDYAPSESTVKSELRRMGVSESELTTATHRVIRAVNNSFGSERGRWIFGAHREVRSEWPVGGLVGNRLISGTIDRAFYDEVGRLWIIDFKTSEHQGANLNRFLDEEQRRYRNQLESYATLVHNLTSGPVWLGLYFPLLDAWREWQFEEIAVPVR